MANSRPADSLVVSERPFNAESQTNTEIEEIGPPPKSRRTMWIRLCAITFVFVGWELVGRQINPLFMSYPLAILSAAGEQIASGELQAAFVQSMSVLLIGYVIASILGILIGLAIGRYRDVDAATDWLVNALYATPLVAVVPLMTLWFGLGFTAKLAIVIKIAVFPVLINTISGVRNVPRPLIELSNAFCASERQIFTKIILPSAVPYMMTGLRLGIGRALIGMVVAEFFTSVTGLGAMIIKYGNRYDTASMFVPILVLMILGILFTQGVRYLEDRLAPWKRTHAD